MWVRQPFSNKKKNKYNASTGHKMALKFCFAWKEYVHADVWNTVVMVAGVVMEMRSVQIFDLLLSVSCLKIDTSYLQKKRKKNMFKA